MEGEILGAQAELEGQRSVAKLGKDIVLFNARLQGN